MMQLEFRDVSFTYPEQNQPVLRHISFRIGRGEFVLLCGPSGCGKTTLLKHMIKSQIPFGIGTGEMLFEGRDIEKMPDYEAVSRIGYVGQSPENQIVTNTVWHELAFSLESMGISVSEIRKRTAEMAEYFGLRSLFRRKTAELSGGQKQILNLASVMVLQPELLILDEPTSQLDPIAAERFLQTLEKLHTDFGITILITEQRLEQVLSVADRVMIMQDGRLSAIASPEECGKILKDDNNPVYQALPAAVQVFMERGNLDETCPLTVGQGRQWLDRQLQGRQRKKLFDEKKEYKVKSTAVEDRKQEYVIEVNQVSFHYPKSGEVLRDFTWKLPKGSIYGLLGGNGSGKTTALKIMAGIYHLQAGACKVKGQALYLPQNPKAVLTEITVEDELAELLSRRGKTRETILAKVEQMLQFMELKSQRKQHPYDLSGGQQQRLALAKVLLLEPDILLLDEPTKGLDAAFKEKLGLCLQEIVEGGVTIVLVSHDVEFCAKYATHCGLLFDGEVISSGETRQFFANNYFYNTAAARMSAELLPEILNVEDILLRLQEIRRESLGKDIAAQEGNIDAKG